jgi:hypothetical protein
MLEIDVALEESYDEQTSCIVVTQSFRVRLEHSLVSASKWESLWKEAFLGKKDKTPQQTLSYVKFMVLDDDLPPEVFFKLIQNHLGQINDYIIDEMTASKLRNDPSASPVQESITTELIYYWMISLSIPVEFENWHLNRLITLIRVVNLKNTPQKQMTLQERRALNRSRLAEYNTRG